MPDRIKPEDKKKPALTFIIPIDLTFSISLDRISAENFAYLAGNNNDDVSKVLREFVYKRLRIKNKKELENIVFRYIKEIKQEIYNKLGVTRSESFSEKLGQDIRRYIKNAK